MTGLGSVRNYTRRDTLFPRRFTAVNVDGYQSRPGGEFPRPLFELVDDDHDLSARVWCWHAKADIDEQAWLADGIIADQAGNIYSGRGHVSACVTYRRLLP